MTASHPIKPISYWQDAYGDYSISNQSEEHLGLIGSFKYHADLYYTYYYAAEHNLLSDLRVFWSEREEFEEFLAEPRTNIPQLCILSVEEDRTAPPAYRLNKQARVAYRLAAHQIALQPEPLRNESQYPVIFIAPPFRPSDFRDFFSRFVKDAVRKLYRLTGGAMMKVTNENSNDDPDTLLEAIERLEKLSSPQQPLHHICFVAGVDGAYEKSIGYEQTGEYLDMLSTEKSVLEDEEELEEKEGFNKDWRADFEAENTRLTPEDVAQREKVARLVRALVRLFGNKNFGKLVFVVRDDFTDRMKALVDDGTPCKEVTYWEPRRVTPVVSPYFERGGAGGRSLQRVAATFRTR
ncbi:hypothetical protein EV127DRAFT_447480 [Xylaria flabelliformis]|nr:hypothetical protein EV127DRAFT_447480 [Xylaria flabelliformis]